MRVFHEPAPRCAGLPRFRTRSALQPLMNVDLLETVRQDILYRPERFCAAQWAFARNGHRVKTHGDAPIDIKIAISGVRRTTIVHKAARTLKPATIETKNKITVNTVFWVRID